MVKDKKIWFIVFVPGLVIVLLNGLKLLGFLMEDDIIYIRSGLITGLGSVIAAYMK